MTIGKDHLGIRVTTIQIEEFQKTILYIQMKLFNYNKSLYLDKPIQLEVFTTL